MTPTFSGEVQFAGYSDSSRSGPRITLRLADRDQLQQFVGMEGKRFACVLVEIGDDEQPVEKPAPAKEEKAAAAATPGRPKGGTLAVQAGRMCADVGFQKQVARDYPALWGKWQEPTLPPAERAARVVREVCEIESRAELDHDSEAAERFRHCFRLKWLESEMGVTP